MSLEIFPIKLGVGGCYVIKDRGAIMVDAGATGKVADFVNGMAKIPMDPEEIQVIVVTHGHWDHAGSLKDIQEITKAKVAVHKKEKTWLEEGATPLPPGVNLWGRIFIGIMGLIPSVGQVPGTSIDIVLEDTEFSLEEYGVAGKIIPSPGHSPGSVSVLLDSGEVFVGDLAMNMFPLRIGPGLPIFGDDMSLIKKSWENLLNQGARTVYPAHGGSFSADVIKKAIF